MVPSYYFSSFEERLGIILACGPAIRQFFGYRMRTKSYLPTKERQYPNEDFEKIRLRINLRDIFWYRNAAMNRDRIIDAHPTFQSKPRPPPQALKDDPVSTDKVRNSILDGLRNRIKSLLRNSRNTFVRVPLETWISWQTKSHQSSGGKMNVAVPEGDRKGSWIPLVPDGRTLSSQQQGPDRSSNVDKHRLFLESNSGESKGSTIARGN